MSPLRVPHHWRFSLRSRLVNPRRQPCSVTGWSAGFMADRVLGMVAMGVPSFNDLEKDCFEVLLCAPEGNHSDLLIVERQPQQLCFGRLGVGHPHLQARCTTLAVIGGPGLLDRADPR